MTARILASSGECEMYSNGLRFMQTYNFVGPNDGLPETIEFNFSNSVVCSNMRWVGVDYPNSKGLFLNSSS